MEYNPLFDGTYHLRPWVDSLPLEYKYSLGVAGKTFSEGLKQGKILASKCSRCNESRIPPSIYCVGCFGYSDGYVQVSETGTLYSFASRGDVVVAAVEFKGVKGLLFHRLAVSDRNKLEIGAPVRPVFVQQAIRKGDITDIDHFELAV